MWVGSGAGGSVAAARESGSTARSRWSIVWRNWRSGLARPGASAARRRSSWISCWLSRTARRPMTEASPRDSKAGVAAVGERPAGGSGTCRGRPTRRRGRAAPAAGPARGRRAGPCRAPARPGTPAARGSRRRAARAGWPSSRPSGRPRARSDSRRSCAPRARRPRGRRPRSATRSSSSGGPARAASRWSRAGPGAARRITSLRSSGRPARPAPSSPTIRRSRSRYGRRRMLLTRSSPIVELVWSTGTRPPSGSRLGEVPGWQSTKYSPMNDCGRTSQRASSRRSASPGSVTSASTTASGRAWPSRRTSPVLPARTPAISKSPPSVRPKALSSTIS